MVHTNDNKKPNKRKQTKKQSHSHKEENLKQRLFINMMVKSSKEKRPLQKHTANKSQNPRNRTTRDTLKLKELHAEWWT